MKNGEEKGRLKLNYESRKAFDLLGLERWLQLEKNRMEMKLEPVKLADKVGFEPTERLHARQFSRLLLSTTQPPVLKIRS